MGRAIEFLRPDGTHARGYYAAPEKNPATSPGIVLVSEESGLTSHVMEIANRYATNGFRVLAPDVFGAKTAKIGLDDAVSQDVRGALQHLKSTSSKVGVSGYGMGAAVALLAAMHLTEPDVAVVFYGVPPSEAGDPATIEVPLQCHFAKHDDVFPAPAAQALEKRLVEGHVPYELYWYDAKHGFGNPDPLSGPGYNSTAAHESWERALKFWKNTLHG